MMSTKIIRFLIISAFAVLLLGISVYCLSTDLPANVPEIKGSQLKYKSLGDSVASFIVELKFKNSYYDYNYIVDVDSKTEGFLYLEPPPERDNVRIHITAISEIGRRSEPFIFTNKQWWWSNLTRFGKGYTMEHIFKF